MKMMVVSPDSMSILLLRTIIYNRTFNLVYEKFMLQFYLEIWFARHTLEHKQM